MSDVDDNINIYMLPLLWVEYSSEELPAATYA